MKCYGEEKKLAKYRKLEFIECDCCSGKISEGENYFTVEIESGRYEVCEKCIKDFVYSEIEPFKLYSNLKIQHMEMKKVFEEVPETEETPKGD